MLTQYKSFYNLRGYSTDVHSSSLTATTWTSSRSQAGPTEWSPFSPGSSHSEGRLYCLGVTSTFGLVC